MVSRRAILSLAALLHLSFGTVSAQEQEDGRLYYLDTAPLVVGDPAPKLSVQEFVRGEPVAEFERGKIYVVEFWKCGCPPCRAAIPHLNELQKKYPAVIFIGVGVISSPANNKKYVNKSGDHMQYRVAIERVLPGKDAQTGGEMWNSWLQPAGEDGVPTSFIIDGNGRIAWIGHPMKLDDANEGKPLENIVAGKWDLKVAAEKFALHSASTTTRRRVERLPEVERDAIKTILKLAGHVVLGFDENTVTFVQINQPKVNDAVLAEVVKELQKLKGLHDLNLCNTDITDSGMKSLRELATVNYLELRGTRVKGTGLRELSEWKHLIYLDMCGCPLSEAGFQELKALKSLEILMLSGIPMTAVKLEQLKELPKLRILYLADTGLTDDMLQAIQSMPGINNLDLSDNPITDEGLVALTGKILGPLMLRNTQVKGPGIKVLAGLHCLDLSGAPVTDAGLSELKRFPELHHLGLSGTQVTDAGLAVLRHNPKLEFLSLIDTQVTDKGLRNLRELKELGRLELRGTAVTDAGLAELKHLKELNWLDVARTKVTPTGIADLKSAFLDIRIAR